MTDFFLMNYLAKLFAGTVKERFMYTKGVGVYGSFRPYMSMSDYTAADFLKDAETATPVFVRFSKATGKSGSPDTERSVKGFATKFFTKDGNYDLICHNMPVFFISDATKIPALLEALSPNKNTNLADNDSLWNFFAENPEAINLITWLYSDRGTTKSYRDMEGYSVHTYKWVNGGGDAYFVRYKWIPINGVREISKNEAEFLSGFDPDIASKDLYEAIEAGQYPEYELAVQLLPEKNREAARDCTVSWSETEIPYLTIGKMVLNKIPKDFYEEVEKSAFSPSNLITGIAFSDDKLLEVVSFAYNQEAGSRGVGI